MKLAGAELDLRMNDEMCDGEIEARFTTVLSWGQWDLDVGDNCIVLSGDNNRYRIPITRVHEQDWERHMSSKYWVQNEAFKKALTFCRSLTASQQRSLVRRVKKWRDEHEVETNLELPEL